MISFVSQVVSGHGIGKQLGYPTLNFTVPADLELEKGVYTCHLKLKIKKLKTIAGILFYGPRSTFDDTQDSLEVHLFDLPTDLSVDEAEIKVGTKIRAPQRFASKEELVTQIKKDCASARHLLK